MRILWCEERRKNIIQLLFKAVLQSNFAQKDPEIPQIEVKHRVSIQNLICLSSRCEVSCTKFLWSNIKYLQVQRFCNNEFQHRLPRLKTRSGIQRYLNWNIFHIVLFCNIPKHLGFCERAVNWLMKEINWCFNYSIEGTFYIESIQLVHFQSSCM